MFNSEVYYKIKFKQNIKHVFFEVKIFIVNKILKLLEENNE